MRDVTVLAKNETPDLINLNPVRLDVNNVLIEVLGTGIAKLKQKLLERLLATPVILTAPRIDTPSIRRSIT